MGMEMVRKEGRRRKKGGIEELKWHTYFGDPHDLNADGHLPASASVCRPT